MSGPKIELSGLRTGDSPLCKLPHQRVEKDEYDIGDYRYKWIAPEWFIGEIFDTRSLID